MDVAVVSEEVAKLLASGGVKELGEAAGGGLVASITERVKKVFGSDARSLDALHQAQGNDQGAIAELASGLAWYGRRDQAFAKELVSWAAQAEAGQVQASQRVTSGRDSYVAGRDQTVYGHPGE